jgi:lysophospholipase L1-like esterase
MRQVVDEVADAGLKDGMLSAVVDTYAPLLDEGLFPDFVHPGAEGAQKMAQAVQAAISESLAQRKDQEALQLSNQVIRVK